MLASQSERSLWPKALALHSLLSELVIIRTRDQEYDLVITSKKMLKRLVLSLALVATASKLVSWSFSSYSLMTAGYC